VSGQFMRFCRFARFFVLLLTLPIAFERTWPSVVELMCGKPVHVCHCDARGGHASCACAICHPEDPDLKRRVLAVQAPCGDDEHYVAPELPLATVPEVTLSVPAAAWVQSVDTALVTPVLVGTQAPEPPPPRA
jgi:hypothetical protein